MTWLDTLADAFVELGLAEEQQGHGHATGREVAEAIVTPEVFAIILEAAVEAGLVTKSVSARGWDLDRGYFVEHSYTYRVRTP